MKLLTSLLAGCLSMLTAVPALALKSPTPGGVPGPDVESVQPQSLEQGEESVPPQAPVESETPARKPPPARDKSPDTFTPTERIEADSAVSFPVDI